MHKNIAELAIIAIASLLVFSSCKKADDDSSDSAYLEDEVENVDVRGREEGRDKILPGGFTVLVKPPVESGNFATSEDRAMFNAIPVDMRKRCSKKDRLSRLKNNGGNEQCEEAVVKSLYWLNKTQNSDGSWGDQYKVAMTGFALLAYLAHCETPDSEEFGNAVRSGIVFLVDVCMKNDGKMASSFGGAWSYEHGIATYALAESATFCGSLGIKIPNIKEATKMAGDFILDHQHAGSWDYAYAGKRVDNSIALWQIQALKACRYTGLWKDTDFGSVIQKALECIKKSQADDGGIGYAGARGSSMTGGGALAYQIWGQGQNNVVEKATKYIIEKDNIFEWGTEHADLYRHYYNAQAMINRGGEEWNTYNKIFRDEILKNQNLEGSYKPCVVNGSGHLRSDIVHYRTCLATLMLEVYYRFTAVK